LLNRKIFSKIKFLGGQWLLWENTDPIFNLSLLHLAQVIAPMSALVLDGKALAEKTEQELSTRVAALKARTNGQTPILATILVGNDPASALM
jgi:hypothetical protein